MRAKKNNKKKLAVWMDHSEAHYFEYEGGTSTFIGKIDSPYQRIKREEGESNDSTRFSAELNYTSNNENKKNSIAKNERSNYYKEIEKTLNAYDEILLFGPTNAKEQLFNYLSGKKHYASKSIHLSNSDKLSDNQKLAEVRKFYGDNKV